MSNTTLADSQQVVNEGDLYINHFSVANNTTTPNTKLDLGYGQCRDSSNVFDINITDVSTTLDATVNGLNGLDTGTLAVSSDYAIYVVADGFKFKKSGFLISLSTDNSPFYPQGWNICRRIGWAKTDSSGNFILFDQSGSSASDPSRMYQWRTPISITSTITGTFAAKVLTPVMPPVQSPVILGGTFTAVTTAGDVLYVRPTGSASTNGISLASGSVQNVAQVIPPTQIVPLLASGIPSIDIKATSASDTVALVGVGFIDYL